MPELPEEWRAYASLQATLDERTTIDSTAWGIEAGLNGLLDGSSSPATVSTTVESAARRSRYAQALLAKYMRIDVNYDGLAQLEARSALEAIEWLMPDSGVAVLWAGANESGLRGACRTRLSRARAMARLLVA